MKQEFKYIAILIVLASVLYLFGLGSMPLTDPDETFYAQTAKEMVNSDEWITPTIFGKPQFEKPILYYWLIEISYKMFGINEFAARFPSAVFGIIGIMGIYLLGRLIFSPFCGFLAGLIMATSGEYLVLARGCVTDMVLTVFILLCITFFLYGWQKEDKRYYFLSAISAALAVLTKGPIGLFLPGLVILIYLMPKKRWMGVPRRIPVFWCFLTFFAVALPWYLLAAKAHGATFISEFFGFQNVTRFLVPEHRIGSSPLFYPPVILAGMLPWTLFLIFGTWQFYKKNDFESKVPGYKLFLTAWFMVVFIFFTVSRTKLVTYIFPLFPVLAFFPAKLWERYIESKRADSRLNLVMDWSFYVTTFISIVGFVAGIIVIRMRYGNLIWALIPASIIFVIMMGTAIFYNRKNHLTKSFMMVVAAFIVAALVASKWIAPTIGMLESDKTLVQTLNLMAKPGEPVAGEDDSRRGIAFYSDRVDIVDVHPYNNLIEFVSRPGRVWAILRTKHYRQLKEQMPDMPFEEIATSGKDVLITNKPIGRNAN